MTLDPLVACMIGRVVFCLGHVLSCHTIYFFLSFFGFWILLVWYGMQIGRSVPVGTAFQWTAGVGIDCTFSIRSRSRLVEVISVHYPRTT